MVLADKGAIDPMNDGRNKSLVARNTALSDSQSAQSGNQAIETEKVSLGQMWDVLRRRWWAMLATLVIVLGIGIAYTATQRPLYQSVALMEVASQNTTASSDDISILNDLAALTRSRTVQSQLEMISSPEIVKATAEAFGPARIRQAFNAKSIPHWGVTCAANKGADVISVTVKSYDASMAAQLANTLVSTYLEHGREYANRASAKSRALVLEQIQASRERLDAAQKALSDYKRTTKLIAIEDQLRTVANGAIAVRAERDHVSVELASMRNQARQLRGQLAEQGSEIQENSTIQLSPQYQEALTNLGRLQTRRATLAQQYLPESREMRNIAGEIADVEQQMKKVAETITASRVRTRNPVLSIYLTALVNEASEEARLRALDTVIAESDKQVAAMPEQERTLAKIMEQVKTLEHNCETLSDKYDALLVNEKASVPGAMLASSAQIPDKPVSPNWPLSLAVFILLGLFLASVTAVTMEHVDSRIRDDGLAAMLVGGEPLSVIPDQKTIRGGALRIDALNQHSPYVEAFRMLRNVIALSETEEPIKTMAVTSPGRAEGKSTTCMNLAIATAMLEKKVLVVDCDLRCPSLHKHMKLDNDIGLSSIATGVVSAEMAVRATEIGNVFCITSGPLPPNPAELLASQTCRDSLQALRNDYDLVILDCPPCAGLGDIQVISGYVDGVLLVVTVGQSLRESLYGSISILGQVNAPLVGFVLNRMDLKKTRYGYYTDS